MKLLLTIRTADRSPKKNYLGQTVRSLRLGGVSAEDIHVIGTTCDAEWIYYVLDGALAWIHTPSARRTANQNGVAQIDLLGIFDADWIIMSEDDLEWCADPLGSMARWLEDYSNPDVLVYRFFAFDHLTIRGAHAATAPLREMKGSQVIALRSADARRFAAWAREHPKDWRPKDAPFQDQPDTGFDKLVGYWALQDRLSVPYGLVSRPFFVRHLGVESSLHRFGRTMDIRFAGTGWSYSPKVPA